MNKNIHITKPWFWLATWFGCGLARPAPGTWGTLGAVPFGVFLMMGGTFYLSVGIVFVTLIGLWAADQYEKESGEHDSSIIVIDEVAGLWVTLLAAAPTPLSVLLAVLAFRFFDVLKPWPISWCDKKIPGARGVMIDDIVAGIMAALFLYWLRMYAGIG
ncbi:MAG TPA: phosphatidylglycerophosphatase A [Alphaproteobacteria bacterium]